MFKWFKYIRKYGKWGRTYTVIEFKRNIEDERFFSVYLAIEMCLDDNPLLTWCWFIISSSASSFAPSLYQVQSIPTFECLSS